MIIMRKDTMYTYVKKAYSQMNPYDLDEAGLPHIFDLLTTQQKEFFVSFFEIAQNDFRDEYDVDIRDHFLNEVERELGYPSSDIVEDILARNDLKICK